MGDLLKKVKTTKKVQTKIEEFESLTLNENKQRSRSTSRARTKPIIEVEPEAKSIPLLTAISSKHIEKPVDQIADTRYALAPNKTVAPAHKRHDSAVFIKKDYLRDNAPQSLSDDAREILKSQPGLEDIEAVLAYVQYGMEGQHEFNIKVTGPKSSQLVRVLVATTIPDLWPNLSLSKIDELAKRIRGTLLQALFSVTGLEALLEQIRYHTRPSANKNREAIVVYVGFLTSLLEGSEVVLNFLSDTTRLYDKEIQRRLFWQSIVSLLAGSKILSGTVSIPNAIAETDSSLNVPDWLIRGEAYCTWLARNIVKAAIELDPKETETWLKLSQLLKRGLSLGYRGELLAVLLRAVSNTPQTHSYRRSTVLCCLGQMLCGRLCIFSSKICPHMTRRLCSTAFSPICREATSKTLSTCRQATPTRPQPGQLLDQQHWSTV